MKVKKNSGFTLIELLIVIGLLGALTALILPSLSADREDAIGDVCDYNQAGTVRVLKQYKQLTGVYPDDMHNGMTSTGSDAVAMGGIPDAQAPNMLDNIETTRHALTANEAISLAEAGIDSICSGTGLNRTVVAEGVNVATCTTDWLDDTPASYSFDGVGIADWLSGDIDGNGTAGDSDIDEGPGVVVVFWIAPTTNWEVDQENANKDWGKGNVELGIDLEGQCPVPVENMTGGEPDFSYYMAYFKVYSDGSTAKLIGTSCPECGVINP